MSLAVLPHSPVNFHQQSPAALSCPTRSSAGPPKRPKLTLNTSHLPLSLGKGNTTGRLLEPLSVASPTSRNTFQNAYGPLGPHSQPARPSASRANVPTPLRTSSTDSVVSLASATSVTSATSATSSISSASSADSSYPAVPYWLPYNTKSILTNGPIPRVRRGKSFSSTRPMFRVPKKVSFRTNLTEEIRTERYTMAHSDLESSTSSISTLILPPLQYPAHDDSTKPSVVDHGAEGGLAKTDELEKDSMPEQRSPHTGDKRESSDEEDSDVCPSTPVTRMNKRPREWVWTLGPVKSDQERKQGAASPGREKTGEGISSKQ